MVRNTSGERHSYVARVLPCEESAAGIRQSDQFRRSTENVDTCPQLYQRVGELGIRGQAQNRKWQPVHGRRFVRK
jgi:hypothetical protein